MSVNRVFIWVVVASILAAYGCAKPPATTASVPANQKNGASEHQHAAEGPHGGELLELGTEEFHAEFIHDEKGKHLTVHILDGEGKQPVPIDATQLTINLIHDGKAEQFAVPASPEQSDPQGKSSRFQSEDAELNEDLELASGDPQLVVEIAGKQYRAVIHHDRHDHTAGEHAGHNHKE